MVNVYYTAMKLRAAIFLITIYIAGCNEPNSKQPELTVEEAVKKPVGLVIASDSMKIASTDLSSLRLADIDEKETYFKVAIKTTNYSHKGRYEIATSWYDREMNLQFSMPRGAEDVMPVLVKMPEPYSFLVGFYYGKDTTFYDYYSIKGSLNGVNAGYTKAYSFR